MKLIVIYFLEYVLFCGVTLDLDKYIFLWQTYFFWGGRLRLVLLYSSKYSVLVILVIWNNKKYFGHMTT
jgi:hypothetical protein